MNTLFFRCCHWILTGFSTSNTGKYKDLFCKWLRSYNPATCVKSSFQITNRHVTTNILSKSISPDFLTCVRQNQKKKEKKKGGGGELSAMFMQFPSKGADSWLNPDASWADCRWSTLLSPPSATAINQNHYRDTGQRKTVLKPKGKMYVFNFSVCQYF